MTLSMASTMCMHNTKPSRASVVEASPSSKQKCNTRTDVKDIVLVALLPAKNLLVPLCRFSIAGDCCAPSEEAIDDFPDRLVVSLR
jgi:hypothetical protein